MKHRWADTEPVRLQYTTDRICSRCGMIRRTRHEPGAWPWVEWWNGETQIRSTKTPVCEAASELA